MAFPHTPLTVLGELALGADLTADPATWSWTDVTSYLYTRDAINISRGRGDQASLADTSKLSVTANNRDGRWSTRNPNGAWYGTLRKGTPIRISAEGHVRYAGFLSELPPRWDLSGRDRYAPLSAQGLLYRLTQGATPTRSAVARTILGKTAPTPIAYWPLEDDASATQAASGLSDGSPLLVAGGLSPIFGVQNVLGAGVAAGVDLAEGGSLVGTIPATASTAWSLSMIAQFTSVAPVINQTVMDFLSGGRTNGGLFVFTDALLFTLTFSGSSITLTGPVIDDDETHHIVVTVTQSGTSINAALIIDGVTADSDTLASATVDVPMTIRVNSGGFTSATGPVISHLAIYTEVYSDSLLDAIAGYDGEEAAVRFLRLSEEEGIPAECAATPSQAMGPQPVDAYLPLIRQCEATDQGYLYENLEFGLTLQGHQERENLDPALELDYEEPGHVAPPLESTDDDREALNDIEVKREGGSLGARATEEDPAVELSIPNIGRRDDSKTYSLSLESQTRELAWWRLHMGTWPGYRFPSLSVNLAAGPSLITDVTAAGLAYRVTVTNPPEDIGPDLVDLVVEGYSETLGPFDWLVQNNCSLYGPWRVGEIATPSADTNEWAGRLAGDVDAAIRIAIDSDDTSVVIDPNRYRSSVAAGDFDPDLRVRFGGETADISSIATTAATYVAAGAASHADNAAVTPAMFAGATARDGIFVLAAIRSSGTGTVTMPADYARLTSVWGASLNAALFFKAHSGSESNPTVTPVGGAAGDTVTAFTFGFRGTPSTLTDPDDMVVTALALLNASAANIAYGGIYPRYQEGCVVLLLAWKQDDYTSIAVPSGFTEILEASTTTGSDQSLYAAYAIQTTSAVVNEGSLVVTGGASAISRSAVVAIAAGSQTLTVSARSVNGVVKSHAAATRIEVDNPFVLAL